MAFTLSRMAVRPGCLSMAQNLGRFGSAPVWNHTAFSSFHSSTPSSGGNLGSFLAGLIRNTADTVSDSQQKPRQHSQKEVNETEFKAAEAGFDTHSKDKSSRWNTIFRVVPNKEEWVVERLGKFHHVAEPGLRAFVPGADRIRYSHTTMEQMFHVCPQRAVTQDNVTVYIDGNVYVKVNDAVKASYHSERPYSQLVQLAQTTVRAQIGDLPLDECFKNRELINARMKAALDRETLDWGMEVIRFEMKDIRPISRDIEKEMERQSTAERRRRETVKAAEGEKEAAMLVAEGKKQAAILVAEGEAEAIKAMAAAQAKSLKIVGEILEVHPDAAQLDVARMYAQSWGKFAESGSSTLIVPGDPSNISSMVGTAFQAFKAVNAQGDPLMDKKVTCDGNTDEPLSKG